MKALHLLADYASYWADFRGNMAWLRACSKSTMGPAMDNSTTQEHIRALEALQKATNKELGDELQARELSDPELCDLVGVNLEKYEAAAKEEGKDEAEDEAIAALDVGMLCELIASGKTCAALDLINEAGLAPNLPQTYINLAPFRGLA